MKAELLISLRMSMTVSLLFLLCISGVVAQDRWAVNYNSKSFCALKGSAVTMECTYTPPSGQSVQKAFWTKELVTSGSEPPDLLDDPEYRGRVLYLGDEHRDCTVRFKNLREKDQSKYYFTFITDQPGGKYQGEGGVDLSVTDLQVEIPEKVKEGDNVTLTCKTTCSLTVTPTFTWYRNGQKLSSSTDQLHLQPVSGDNKDRYHCAVLGLNSPEVTLNVELTSTNVTWIIVVAVIAVLGALLCIVVFVRKSRQRPRDPTVRRHSHVTVLTVGIDDNGPPDPKNQTTASETGPPSDIGPWVF